MTNSQLRVGIVGTLIWCGLVIGFLVLSFPLGYASVDSLIFASWVCIAVVGVAEILLPGKVIAWRNARIAQRPPQAQTLASSFSKAFRITEPGDAISRRNLRLVGFAILIGGSGVMFLLRVAIHV